MQPQTVVTTARRVARTTRTVGIAARDAQLSFVAASLAYYMLVSLLPLGVLALVVATTLGGEAFAARVAANFETLLSATATGVLQDALLDTRGRGGATVLGVLLLLWSGLRVFRGIDVAFSLVYGHGRRDPLLDQLRDALVALAGIAIAVIAIAAVTALVALSGIEIVGILAPIALVGTLAVAFLPLYLIFPDADVGIADALPGTLVAAVGWALLSSTFALYAAASGSSDLYGVLGGVLLLVTWFYVASLLLLVGAVVNAVIAGRTVSDRHLQQEALRTELSMADNEGDGETPPPGDPTETVEPASEAEVERLREELEDFRSDVETRTLHRESIEEDLRGYVRREIRSGHARDWGPYLVLLYGTLMTIGGFYYLEELWAVLAMLVIWLSTLGLYVLMVMVGAGLDLAALPARAIGRFRNQ